MEDKYRVVRVHRKHQRPPPSPSIDDDFQFVPSNEPGETQFVRVIDPATILASQPSQLPSPPPDTYLLGFVTANIVGLRYYSGTISGREMVGLVREPLNPYDENAIKVLNTRSVQVGHIERSVALVLAPLIDSNVITVEGIVPNGRAASHKFRIPCQVHIFSEIVNFPALKEVITRGGLQLITDSDVSFTLSEAMAVRERKANSEVKSVDEIFKLVDEHASKKGVLEALEPPRHVIRSELFVHQKEGLGWLVHRENSTELPPFWEEKDGDYVNVLTNYLTDRRPEPLRGGIFADDMGLGKTLTLLSLIAYDKDPSVSSLIDIGGIDDGKHDQNREMDEVLADLGGKKGKRGRPGKNAAVSQKRRKTENIASGSGTKLQPVGVAGISSTGMETKTTLVVCPPSVFATWIDQLEEHTKSGTLRTYMYYGDRRTKNAEELKKYDLVLTTYTTLGSEENCPNSPVKKVEWWRIILDEAHMIKNANAQQSRAVTNLVAKRRWAVTGTPIQNGSYDLFSLMAFLKFEPFSIKSYWQSLVQRPLTDGSKSGLSRLQVLMASLSLRRTKDKALLELPPKTIETCFIELSREERELYDRMEVEGKRTVEGYISNGSLMHNYSTVLSIILRLRQICTDLALCPSDLKSLLPSNNIEDISNNPELLQKLVEVLQDGEDFDCPICICPPTDTVITCCAHIFCQNCILKTLRCSQSCCPLCRRPLTESDLFLAPPQSSEVDSTEKSSSSKLSALIKLLEESREKNPAGKSVVFSQFRKMLLLMEEPLRAAGFKVLRLDGTMNAKRRAQVIGDFRVSGADVPTVLLASLRASGAGINLTAASRVYLMEPWWNPAVEEQAMDRIHRIGQKQDVKIVRLIARNSIEERVLELQEKKKKLAREAFGGKGAKGGKEVGLEDIRALMSL